MDGKESPAGIESSIHVQISELSPKRSDTMFELQPDIPGTSPPAVVKLPLLAPEKNLTLFALRLAVLEKAASGIGTMAFVWATVVLLGGFAITLEKSDFWFITIILLSESTRIFSRSHELEWQHHSTWYVSNIGINSFRAIVSSSSFVVKTVKSICRPTANATSRNDTQTRELPWKKKKKHQAGRKNWHKQRMPTRTWSSSEVPLLPYAKWIFLSRNASKLLYWLQLASATACVALSVIKLVLRNYGEVEKGDTDKRNRKFALMVFYCLALVEALLFLLEKAYWQWKFSVEGLLETVNRECELGDSDLISTRRFFYDAYSKSINGSIFDGLKMDMVSFSIELLHSKSPDEQQMGARVLRKFATNSRFSEDTLEKIGINVAVMERLVEMLNWTDPEEEEIRYSAAEILSELAGRKQNSHRIAVIPGSIESASSLLHVSRNCHNGACYDISEKLIHTDDGDYSSWEFNHVGMKILKKLARDQDICEKIGNTKGLLFKITDFMHAEERILRHPSPASSQISMIKKALQVVKMLASNSGVSGQQLRRDISEIVFTFSYIRDILRYGEKYPDLQMLSIEILTNLSIEKEATERIGNTGGLLKELSSIFFIHEIPETQSYVRVAAGEALSMLTLDGNNACQRILNLNINMKLMKALEIPLLRINAARILRNFCAYGNACYEQLEGLTAAIPAILEALTIKEHKLQEAMLGAASCLLKLMPSEDAKIFFKKGGKEETELAHDIFAILVKYEHPSLQVPNIRRYAIELSIWMMREDKANVGAFEVLGMEKQLKSILETTSQLECYHVFFGTVGLCMHSVTMESLVQTAFNLLQEEQND